MSLRIDQLKPYKSLSLFQLLEVVSTKTLVNGVLDDIEHVLDFAGSDSRERKQRRDGQASGDTTVGYIHYVEDRYPTWTTNQDVVDRLNHLVVVCQYGRLVAICVSDSTLKPVLLRYVRENAGSKGLSALSPVPHGKLNAAFVSGPTRTLWLAGTHRRVTVKADSKILAGLDLRDALDPLDDQTYYFSAARSMCGDLGPIGMSPRKSGVWAGPSVSWSDFQVIVRAILKRLEGTVESNMRPLPVLAVASSDPAKIKDAYDVSLQPPELLSDDPSITKEERQETERWVYGTYFVVKKPDKAAATVEVSLKGQPLGTLTIKPDITDPLHVRLAITDAHAQKGSEKDFDELLRLCRQTSWLKIRYDSGHTLSDGSIFEVRHRPYDFLGFEWIDFTGWDIDKEKPDRIDKEKPDRINWMGHQKSLFDWVLKYWPNLDNTRTKIGRWLACDDGSMEIADFIHFDPDATPPMLTMIHVKAAGCALRTRGISVSKYEVVTGQAVKNLRYLDNLEMAGGLKKGLGKDISKLVWLDGNSDNRENMIAAVSKPGVSYQKKVVVLQPHLTLAKHDAARRKRKGADYNRLRQLDTLLLGAEAACHALGARFQVISAK